VRKFRREIIVNITKLTWRCFTLCLH